MIDISFKAFGIFCFSIICFGVGTFLAGVLFSFGDSDYIFPMAWLVGTVFFGGIMMFEHGYAEAEEE